MNVSEMIELLKTFPQDAPVAYTYETVVVPISDDVYLSADGVVMIGDDYRKEFESGEMLAKRDWRTE